MMNKQAHTPLLAVENLVKHFSNSSMFGGDKVRAVDDISFSMNRGEIFALVGESGCGKSTTARLIMRLINATAGRIVFDGEETLSLGGEALRRMRRHVQMIFQDPYGSLNPRWRVESIVAEPLKAHGIGKPSDRRDQVVEMLRTVGLGEESVSRYPHEFSGGQRQRIGIARALITRPKLVICDEPISALDVSIQAQIINLLKDLQREFDLTYLFITHDLRVVKYLCDHVGVMYLGKIVEMSPREEIFAHTLHPYTQALFSAIPYPDPDREKNEVILEGDVPSPINPPPGCYFHTRCPRVMDVCARKAPRMQEVKPGHFCACHLYEREEDSQ